MVFLGNQLFAIVQFKALVGMLELRPGVIGAAPPAPQVQAIFRPELFANEEPFLLVQRSLARPKNHEGHNHSSAGTKMAVKAPQRFPGVARLRHQLKGARGNEDRVVAARQFELLDRLVVKIRL